MAKTETQALTFREMTLSDLDEVMRVESRAYAYPWTRGIFSDCLTAGHECRVACRRGDIVGHCVLSAAVGEAHLLNVCIMRECQGQGLGREFVHHIIGRARILGAQTLFLEVRPTNRVAMALYESLGFQHIGTRRDYYPAELGREDAFVFGLNLAESTD